MEAAPQWAAMFCGSDRDVVVVDPEVDLVAGFDPELVAELFGDDDLSLGSDPVSHTIEYNYVCGAEREVTSDHVVAWNCCPRLHEIFDEIEAIEKPVVLAAQGPCLSIGVELSASCDFRLAATSAHFGLLEVPNLAVLSGSGGISRLTRIVGPHWARWIAMAAETVTAEEAVGMGYVHRVLPDEGFDEAVLDWCKKLITNSAEALGLAKVAIDAAVDSDRRTARNFDRLANTELLHSAEHRAKIEQFLKRSGG